MKILCVIGTRPEGIKMAPVIQSLRASPHVDVRVLSTGQHKELLASALDLFGIVPDDDLAIMTPGQSLADVSAKALQGIDRIITEWQPHIVLVQGDTTTAFCGALAAFYRKVPIGHIEAGLRTWNNYSPFPEEANRCLISRLADWHFAPTDGAKENLIKEGVPPEHIYVTGNTGIDALLRVAPAPSLTSPRALLVTMHRRENQGERLQGVCEALRDLVARYEDIEVLFPVHPSPDVRKVVMTLKDTPRIRLLEPLAYGPFAALLAMSYLVLTDSGGLQEEAPALGKPVLVLRDTTERPEGIQAGTALLIGTDRQQIVNTTSLLLDSPVLYNMMAHATNPYGDGQAAERITSILLS